MEFQELQVFSKISQHLEALSAKEPISLRDEIALRAMQGELAKEGSTVYGAEGKDADLATFAYKIADAMLSKKADGGK